MLHKTYRGGGVVKRNPNQSIIQSSKAFYCWLLFRLRIFGTLGTPDISAIKCVKNPSLNVLGNVSVRYFVKMRILNSLDSWSHSGQSWIGLLYAKLTHLLWPLLTVCLSICPLGVVLSISSRLIFNDGVHQWLYVVADPESSKRRGREHRE